MISAKIIADSKNQFGDRITSFELVMPRIILAEFNTHRMFSRNSASSRAIKFSKMLEMIKRKPFIPIAWMKDHKGMQGNEYFNPEQKFSLTELKDVMFTNLMKIYDTEDGDNPDLIEAFGKVMDEFELFSDYTFEEFWLMIRDKVINCALLLAMLGLTKQIVNRLLEPFMWHKVILTSTEFENFFALRYNEAAEIHIQELSRLMLFAYNASTPKELKDGEWHIPYGDDIKMDGITNLMDKLNFEFGSHMYSLNELRIKIATSRCAGVSYTVIGEDGEVENYEKLIKRHDNLSKSGHLSPFEHCAKAMNNDENYMWTKSSPTLNEDKEKALKIEHGWCGNFKGFIQYRKMFENENKTDSRVIKK